MQLTSLRVVVELIPGRGDVTPDVRFWFDQGFSGDLRSETELSLARTSRWSWTGTLLIDRAGAFFYRLGLSAQEGTVWSLRIHDPAQGRDVLVDEDCIDTPKCWLLGSCELRPAEERSTRPPEGCATVIVLADRRGA